MANTPKEPPKDFIDALNEQEAAKKQEQDKAAELQAINKAGIKNVEATNRTTEAVGKSAADIKAGVKITNPDLAKTGDVVSAVDAIHKLNLTTFNTNQGLPQLADNLVKLTEAVQALQKDYETKGVAGLSKQLAALVDKLDGVSKTLSNSKVEVDSGLQKTIDNLQQSINAIEFNPSVNVKAPATKVVTTPIDLSSVEEGLKAVVAAVQEQESPETDLSPVTSGLEAVQSAITSLRFPVPNYILPYQTSDGKDTQVILNPDGSLPITATISTGALATSANQTNASQKTQIVDGSGNVIGATTNALDVNIKSGSSAGTQYAELATTAPGTGTLAVGRYKASPPSLTDGQLYGLQLDSSGNLKVTGSLSVGGTTDNSAFTAGTSTGTPSMGFYHSTIDTVTDGRAAALAIDSKRNLLNVIRDAAGNARGANVTAANELLVSVNNASISVTGTVTANSGTNLNTSLLALESGGNLASIKTDVDNLNLAQGSTTSGQKGNLILGAVTTAAPSYTTAQSSPLSLTTTGALRVDGSAVTQPVSGTVTTSPPSNASTNIAQINGVTPLMGAGNTGTGSPRVTIASDQASIPVAATLSAETTKVIGVVRNSDGAGNLLTTNSSTYTAKFALDGNLLGTLGTAFSTAGKVDVKGADGDVFVRQATGTNLHTVIDSGTVSTITNVVHVDDNSGSLTVDNTALTTADLDTGAGTDTRGVNGIALGKSGGALILASGQQTMANSLPITVASDQTSFPVTVAAGSAVIGHVIVDSGAITATLAAETTKVIGTVRNADGAGNLLTTNSTTYTAKFAQDGNLLGTLGTAFSTAGKVDVKGADGDVFVRQATGTNLHTVIDSGTITTVSTLTGTTTLTPGTGVTNLGKAEDQASADGDVGVGALAIRKAVPANTSGTDGDYEYAQVNAGRQWVWAQPNVVTISTSITRPADTAAYTANDAFANSTTVPTTGGFTLTGAALASGGTGIITDAVITASAGTNYIGEIWIFDQAVTATNDNAALSVADADILNLVGVIPFQTSDINAANSISYVTGLNIGYTCVGTANLRFLVKIMSAVTPASAEVLSVRVKVQN